jgi:hypothetical protein
VLTVAGLTELEASSVRRNRGGFQRHRGHSLNLLLKTRTAENRSALCWLEGNGSVRTACRAGCTGLGPHAPAARTFRLALLAVLGIVLELFIVEEELLARGEHEVNAAVSALQDSVDKFHGRFPKQERT